jgi:hypothetical protein
MEERVMMLNFAARSPINYKENTSATDAARVG